MPILVTGCAGFIGSHLTAALLRDDDEVVGMDDLNDAYDTRLKEWRLAQLQGSGSFRFVHGDVCDAKAVTALFDEDPPESVFHLAARAGVRQSLEDPGLYVDTNVHGTLNLLEACRRHDVDRLLLASTSSLYGAHNPRPYREDADTTRPLSPYAASKKGAEAMAAAYAHLYGIATPVVRYFTVYGPAGRPDMSIFRFIKWIAEGTPLTLYGDGEQERDFTYVSDIVAGTRLVLDKVSGFDIVNLGSDDPHTINHVISSVEERLGKKARVDRHPMHEADVRATWADISKARALGWTPRVSLAEGLDHSIRWFEENATMVRATATGA